MKFEKETNEKKANPLKKNKLYQTCPRAAHVFVNAWMM